MTAQAVAEKQPGKKTSLVAKMAEKFAVDPGKFMTTLKATAFKQRDGSAPTDEQMMALMVVADQYGLNPFTKEIYAFPDKQNGIIPVVGVDGWSRIINSHPAFDGLDFRQSDNMIQMEGAKVKAPEWMEVVIYRKDREKPVIVREYLDEVYRAPFEGNGRNGKYQVAGPWQTHPKRFLRHKTLIQGARIGLGYTGIYDKDEAERIIDAQVVSEQDGQGNVVSMHSHANGALALTDQRKAEIDQMVTGLAQRVAPQRAWSSAEQYLNDRFSGQEFAYAKEQLKNAEMEAFKAEADAFSAEPEAPIEASAEPEVAEEAPQETPAAEQSNPEQPNQEFDF